MPPIVNIAQSKAWINKDKEYIYNILNDTIEDLLNDDDKIINIQMITDTNGSSMFWIYYF